MAVFGVLWSGGLIFARSSNGRNVDSESINLGSNPSLAASVEFQREKRWLSF